MPAAHAVGKDLSPALTATDRAFISRQGALRLGLAAEGWPPFDIVARDGSYSGVTADYIKLVERHTGLVIKPAIYPTWSAVFHALREGRVDLVGSVARTSVRAAWMGYTQPYLDTAPVIVTRKDRTAIDEPADLSDVRIAIERSGPLPARLARRFPSAVIQTYPNAGDALRAVARGDAAAFVGNEAVASYAIHKSLMPEMAVRGTLEMGDEAVCDWGFRVTSGAVGRAAKRRCSDYPPERRQVREHWADVVEWSPKHPFKLSESQRAWLESHPVIRMGVDAYWPPYEFVNAKGNLDGLVGDYVDLISQRLGVRIELVPTTSWHQVLQGIRSKRIDMTPAVWPTKARRAYLAFSAPYIETPWVFVTGIKAPYVDDAQALAGRKVAVVDGYAFSSSLKRREPGIDLVHVQTTAAALAAVAEGDAFAAVDDLAVANDLIQKQFPGRSRSPGRSLGRFSPSVLGCAKTGRRWRASSTRLSVRSVPSNRRESTTGG